MDLALRVGDLLLKAKKLVDHGRWIDWLKSHCDLSERSAQGYMRLARHRLNPQPVADLEDVTIKGILTALAKPKPTSTAQHRAKPSQNEGRDAFDSSTPQAPQSEPESKPEADETAHLEEQVSALQGMVDGLRRDRARERSEHAATRSQLQEAIAAHEGILSRTDFNKVLFCLHPDTHSKTTAEQRGNAWLLIKRHEQLLLEKADRQPPPPNNPSLAPDDCETMNRQATGVEMLGGSGHDLRLR
jgi:hypothetical protein